MEDITWELKNLDSLKDYILNDLIGQHENTKDINEAINIYSERFHEMKMKNKTWTEPEIQLVRDNFLMSLEDLSELVGRSMASVLNMKYKLKNQGFEDENNYIWDLKRV